MTSTSIPRNTEYEHTNTVPKQVLDVVNLANKVNNGTNFRCHLELDTLGTTPMKSQQPTQVFSDIEIDGVLIHGKQDAGAEVNGMPLNVYNQLNQKLNGNLELKPCGEVKVVSYSKQTVKIVGKISVTCTHTTTIKKVHFYVTDIINTKVILGLQFCRAFNLVMINCNEQCECKKVAVDIINSEFPRGLDPGNHSTKAKLPPVDINLKLRPDCKMHIMELYPDLFEGISTMDGAQVRLDIDSSSGTTSQKDTTSND